MSWAAKEIKSLELKKHINAIHCSNNLSLVQRKLFNALLYNAYPDLLHGQQFKILTRDLCKLIGYNSNDYASLKQALLGLITIAIEWNVLNTTTGKEDKWKASSILASAELSNGMCIYEYSKTMKELLYQPEIYGRLKMDLIAKFKSGYGLALYENCIRYQGLPQTPWFSFPIFRKLMGVSDEKYPEFKNFKKRVLDIAIKEVNDISNVLVVPEIERQNKKVSRIRFKLKKDNVLNLEESHQAIDRELLKLLADPFGISQPLANEIIQTYNEDYIREKISLVISSTSFKEGKIRGLAGYLIEALKKDFQPNKSSKSYLAELRKTQESKELIKQEKVKVRKTQYYKHIDNKVNSFIKGLSPSQQQGFFSKFEGFIQQTIVYKFYQKYGLDHEGVRAYLSTFIQQEGHEKFLTFEEYSNLLDEL